jgi:hypothetical protein
MAAATASGFEAFDANRTSHSHDAADAGGLPQPSQQPHEGRQ